jgi:hypothetical protein
VTEEKDADDVSRGDTPHPGAQQEGDEASADESAEAADESANEAEESEDEAEESEDEAEESEDEAEESEDEVEEESEDDSDDEEDEPVARAKDEPEDDDEPRDENEAERAASVAKALGVGEEAEAPAAEDQKPINRAERRRQRAMRRRGGRAEAEAEEPKGRDRNVKKRDELLKRRRRVADATDDDAPPDRLLASEMVDDALARAGAAVIKWTKRNAKVLSYVTLAAIVGVGAFVFFRYRSESSIVDASDALADGLSAEDATIIPKDGDERTEEQKKADYRRIFATDEERDEAALKAYQAVAGEHGSSGAAILAKLGAAGILLDQRKWDEAISAYSEVLDSPLAAADADVRARSLEGKAFAQEGKGQADEALSTFEKLADVPGDGFKVLSKYHQARLLAPKDKTKAKELLVAAREDLQKVQIDSARLTAGAAHRWLEKSIQEELEVLDPSAVPKKPPPGGQLPPDLQEKLKQLPPELQEQLNNLREGKGP